METKHWAKSKTIWLGLLTSVVAMVTPFFTEPGWQEAVIGVLGSLIIILRWSTKEPIGT
jgi:hypothetical protein